MANKTLDEAILNFKANERRADRFINGGENETWVTSGGATVPTVRKLIAEVVGEVEGAASVVLAARDETLDARDDTAAILNDVRNMVGAPYITTRAALAGMTIPSTTTALRTTGRNAVGDGGGGLYTKVSSEPSQADKVRSADGAWWVYVAGDEVVPRLMSAMGSVIVPTHRTSVYITGASEVGDIFAGTYLRQAADPGTLGDNRFKFMDASGTWFIKEGALPQSLYGTIVVLGSSTAAGQGVTGWFTPSQANGWTEHADSWVGKLRTAIGNNGVVINRSVGGRNTVDSVNNFWRDVAPYKPDTVILCTGWNNEPEVTKPNERSNLYLKRLRTLVGYCRQIGAKPVVICALPGPWTDWSGQLAAATQLIKDGVLVVDWSDVLSDVGSRTIADRYQSDSIHANNLGHSKYFSEFPLHFLLRSTPAYVRAIGAPLLADVVQRPFLVSEDVAFTASPIYTEWPSTVASFGSFTVSARAKGQLASGNPLPVLINVLFNGGKNFSVRPSGDYWALYVDGDSNPPVLTSTVQWDGTAFTNACVVFDAFEGRFTYYHNGTLVGSHVDSTFVGRRTYRFNIAGFNEGRRMSGWHVHGFSLMRGAMTRRGFIEYHNDASLLHTTSLVLLGVNAFNGALNNHGNDPDAPVVYGIGVSTID